MVFEISLSLLFNCFIISCFIFAVGFAIFSFFWGDDDYILTSVFSSLCFVLLFLLNNNYINISFVP